MRGQEKGRRKDAEGGFPKRADGEAGDSPGFGAFRLRAAGEDDKIAAWDAGLWEPA